MNESVMNEKEIEQLLKDTGVIMDGHFLLTSGLHSSRFMQCSQLLQYPEQTEKIARMLADPYREQGIAVVIGPAMGGVILAYETARALGARALYAEPSDGKMVLRRGFQIKAGEKVLVVEDAVTTGGSVCKVLDLLESIGITAAGVAVVVDRSAGRVDFGLPAHSLLQVEVQSFSQEDCPLCLEGIPLQKPKSK